MMHTNYSFSFLIILLFKLYFINGRSTKDQPFGGPAVIDNCQKGNLKDDSQKWIYFNGHLINKKTSDCLTVMESYSNQSQIIVNLWLCDDKKLEKNQNFISQDNYFIFSDSLYLSFLSLPLSPNSLPRIVVSNNKQKWNLTPEGYIQYDNYCINAFSSYDYNNERTHPLVIGHRGTTTGAPENTVPAFIYSGMVKSDGFETDLWRTKDNKVVLCHDPTLDRTTNCTGNIHDKTFQEIIECDACNKHNSSLHCNVPSFEEALVVAQKYNLFIVMDMKDTSVIPYIIPIIKSFKMEDQVFASCRSQEQVDIFHQQLDSVNRHRLLSNLPQYNNSFWQKENINGVRGYSINYRSLTKDFVYSAHKHMSNVIAWTVDDYETTRIALSHGYDMIITDSPALILQLVQDIPQYFINL